MSEYEQQPQQHRVKCGCGFDEAYASDAVAKAIYTDHNTACEYETEYTDLSEE